MRRAGTERGSFEMFVIVSYDVATPDQAGRRRLSRVARICENFGQRAQKSVFECKVDPAQFADMKGRLLDVIDIQTDSLRFYFLGSNWRRRVEHIGVSATFDPDGPLIL